MVTKQSAYTLLNRAGENYLAWDGNTQLSSEQVQHLMIEFAADDQTPVSLATKQNTGVVKLRQILSDLDTLAYTRKVYPTELNVW